MAQEGDRASLASDQAQEALSSGVTMLCCASCTPPQGDHALSAVMANPDEVIPLNRP